MAGAMPLKREARLSEWHQSGPQRSPDNRRTKHQALCTAYLVRLAQLLKLPVSVLVAGVLVCARRRIRVTAGERASPFVKASPTPITRCRAAGIGARYIDLAP